MWRFAFGVSWSLTVGYTEKKAPNLWVPETRFGVLTCWFS
jgi:hypothetical protein